MGLILEKKGTSQEEFCSGNYISYSLKGIYRIEQVEVLSLTSTPDKYYVLSQVFDKTIHKTFVPVKTASSMGMRSLVDSKTLEQLEQRIEHLELLPEEFGHNSNKKVKSYEARIKEQGFFEMIHCYFCVNHDLKVTKREDRRYVQFMDRLRNLICKEMSLVCDRPLEVCLKRFDLIVKKYQSL